MSRDARFEQETPGHRFRRRGAAAADRVPAAAIRRGHVRTSRPPPFGRSSSVWRPDRTSTGFADTTAGTAGPTCGCPAAGNGVRAPARCGSRAAGDTTATGGTGTEGHWR